MKQNNDRGLVKRCLEGSAGAWDEFIDRFSGLIYWAIKRKLNKYDCGYMESEARDIYQLLFASIWEKKSLAGVSGRNDIAPWLAVLASNAAVDFIRKKRTEETFLRYKLEPETGPQDQKDMPYSEADMRLLNDAMKQLNESERAYLQLNYTGGKKYKEIAEAFNVPVNTVCSIIARARKKIKKYIESQQ